MYRHLLDKSAEEQSEVLCALKRNLDKEIAAIERLEPSLRHVDLLRDCLADVSPATR